MTTKNNLDFAGFLAFFRGFLPPKIETGPLLSAVLAFLVSTVVILVNTDKGWGKAGDIRDFETGRVADRDVVADRPVVYVDEDETIMRVEAQEKLVPAVFRFSPQVTEKCRNSYQRFRKLAEERFQGDSSPEFFVPVVLAEFPAFFSAEILGRFFDAPDRSPLLEFCAASLDLILEKGVFSFSGNDFGGHNPEEALVLRPVGARVERERVLYTGVITKDKLRDALGLYINAASAPSSFSALGAELLLPFISENVFYSPEDTEQLVAEIRRNVAPVEKYIERGKRVIKKGYLITEDDMKELRALRLDIRQNDVRRDIARILILLFLFLFLLFFSGARIIDRSLTAPETYLVIVLSSLYLTGSILVRSLPEDSMPVSLAFPTALAVMLPAILIHARLALILAMALPLGAFLTGSFDTGSYIIALVSGVTASWVLQGAEKRMDLIQGGLIIAAANCVASLAVLLLQHAALGSYPQVMFWAAFNGLGSGMLVLGFLPPLEHALNAATTFRLIELSDLNSPILKRLFTAAPGTYSHSIMVANLAEAACNEIKANSLLARVGAYYHDIGKMEQPDYFVENQTVYNKHDDLAPRLSATVIRSHVKQGVEKARSLGLPREVIDIIGQHHGNSLITWFYNKALKQEGQVNVEDFSYPGSPPRSRESAVVMLADVTEAAVRTMDKPTAAKMEKFIQELFSAKVEHGQLAQAELTFRDLETIKKAFVRVLAGHYHSRIEYPKLPKDVQPHGAEAPASESREAK